MGQCCTTAPVTVKVSTRLPLLDLEPTSLAIEVFIISVNNVPLVSPIFKPSVSISPFTLNRPAI